VQIYGVMLFVSRTLLAFKRKHFFCDLL